VPKIDVQLLKIDHLISKNSLENNTSLFLEFDMDTTIYMIAAYEQGWNIEVRQHNHQGDAPVVNYKPYSQHAGLTRSLQQDYIDSKKRKTRNIPLVREMTYA
jgi:hypothetical protein